MTKPLSHPHRKAGKAARLRQRPESFRRLSGLSVEKFDELLNQLQPLWQEAEHKRLARPERRRAIGGGRNYDLPLSDRLLLLLMYYRLYVSQETLGFWFDMDDSAVSRRIRQLEPLLAQVFKIPEHKIEMSEEEIEQLFFDATEQPIQRPQKKRQQKRYYSGKKKRHTIKHQVATDHKGRIKAVSVAYPGRVHDKKVYDQEPVQRPPEVPAKGDSGYQGSDLQTPHKKPKGGSLSEQQKAQNRQHARERIVVEHGIGRMKVFQILAQRFRNALSRHTLIFKNVAGLANLRFA
jgi:DDE superfamily endonuclease/Helix-turn-helix of DDE superfamily endonuclease